MGGVSVLGLLMSIPVLVILGIILLGALAILKSGSSSAATKSQAAEAQLIQDLHHGLARMEQRIEALETILLEQQRKGGDQK